MNRDYDKIVEGIATAHGVWLEVDASKLAGENPEAKRVALHQAAKVRGVEIRTSLKGGRYLARLASAANTADLVKRVACTRRFRKRVQVKRITAAKWFRVNNAKDSYSTGIRVIFGKYGRLYMLAPEYRVPACLESSVSEVNLYLAMTARNQYYILYLPKREDRWYRTGMAAIRQAVDEWVQVKGDVYKGYVTTTGIPYRSNPEPDWSKVPSFAGLIDSAFRDRIIRDDSHHALPTLLGLPAPEPEEI